MSALLALWVSIQNKERRTAGTALSHIETPVKEIPAKAIPEEETPSEETVAIAAMAAADNRTKLRRLVLWAVTVSCVVAGCLWLAGTYDARTYVAGSLDEHLWRNFSTHVRHSVKAFDRKYPHNVLLVLGVVHALQVLFCFPLLHVTRMMYGYFFDAWHGGLIGCSWEICIVVIFVIVATQNTPVRQPAPELVGFLMRVGALRSRGILLPFMVSLLMWSVPLVTSTCLVLLKWQRDGTSYYHRRRSQCTYGGRAPLVNPLLAPRPSLKTLNFLPVTFSLTPLRSGLVQAHRICRD